MLTVRSERAIEAAKCHMKGQAQGAILKAASALIGGGLDALKGTILVVWREFVLKARSEIALDDLKTRCSGNVVSAIARQIASDGTILVQAAFLRWCSATMDASWSGDVQALNQRLDTMSARSHAQLLTSMGLHHKDQDVALAQFVLQAWHSDVLDSLWEKDVSRLQRQLLSQKSLCVSLCIHGHENNAHVFLLAHIAIAAWSCVSKLAKQSNESGFLLRQLSHAEHLYDRTQLASRLLLLQLFFLAWRKCGQESKQTELIEHLHRIIDSADRHDQRTEKRFSLAVLQLVVLEWLHLVNRGHHNHKVDLFQKHAKSVRSRQLEAVTHIVQREALLVAAMNSRRFFEAWRSRARRKVKEKDAEQLFDPPVVGTPTVKRFRDLRLDSGRSTSLSPTRGDASERQDTPPSRSMKEKADRGKNRNTIAMIERSMNAALLAKGLEGVRVLAKKKISELEFEPSQPQSSGNIATLELPGSPSRSSPSSGYNGPAPPLRTTSRSPSNRHSIE
eukprot:gnl/TRDRNA2_/TRDRNA2_174617_c3_seq1.p1 gnl/TRDRNA2_/TRDRNA2_174617_c3~~gnl/TRDRNA2_/TRDRNA2_174617_c3_seq1.p1  ORF type:complete len:505 (-),score=78.85 gnl/TRDRNA2_/TRDRNA2_174617_c3_seq1:192-1706(-)